METLHLFHYFPHLCGKVVYDRNRDAGIKGCRAQGETECIRNKGLETFVFTDLDQSAAAVATDLLAGNTHTQRTIIIAFSFLNNIVADNCWLSVCLLTQGHEKKNVSLYDEEEKQKTNT